MPRHDIVIIGAGQAGFSTASFLRKQGFEGSIKLVGGERFPPYQRPPLSKRYLLGKVTAERLLLRKEQFYLDSAIEYEWGCTVDSVDMETGQIETSSGVLTFNNVVLATGSSPVNLPASIGGDLPGVHSIRSIVDIDTIRKNLPSIKELVIVGGGYIGLEAAAVFRQLDVNVTIVEAADRILKRVASPECAGYFHQLHESKGVSFREGTKVKHIHSTAHSKNANAMNVELEDGTELSADAVIVGIGAAPDTELAKNAGLNCDKASDGILVNAFSQTSHPNAWAAGDCAAFRFGDSIIRLESVQNATDQAANIAQNIIGLADGQETAYTPVPWFWSDQFDVKLQIAGLNTGYSTVIERADPKTGSPSYWYFKDKELLAVDAINDAAAFMTARKLLEQQTTIDPETLQNPNLDIKTLLQV